MKNQIHSCFKALFTLCIITACALPTFAQMHLIRAIQHEANPEWLLPPYSLQARVYDFDVTLDSQFIATSGTSNDIRIWDIPTGKLVYSIDNSDSGNTPLRFLPDKKQIAACGSENMNAIVKIINIQTGNVEWIFEHKVQELDEPYVRRIAISRDSRKLLILAGSARSLWSLETGEQLAYYNAAPGDSMQFFSDGIRVFIEGAKKAIILNTSNGETERTIDGLYPQLLYDEKRVVYQNERVLNPGMPNQTYQTSFVTYNLDTNQIENETSNFNFNVSSFARVSPSGETLIQFNPESEVKETCLFQTETATKARTFQTEEIDYFSNYRFSPDGRMLITTKEDKVYLWDISDLDSKIKSPGIFNN